MGAYLTIVNNTPERWQCKLGADEAALKVPKLIFSTLASIAGIIAANTGSDSPISAMITASGAVELVGLPPNALDRVHGVAGNVTKYANIGGQVSDFGAAVISSIAKSLDDAEYYPIEAGQRHRWGPLTLSLWQQGTCVKTTNVDASTVRLETVYMRPIFSGSTDGANRDHDIRYWLQRNGVETKEIVAEPRAPVAPTPTPTPTAPGSVHAGGARFLAADDALEQLEAGQVILFFPNGTHAVASSTQL